MAGMKPLGWNPPQTSGRLRFHAVGCWVDGGRGLAPGVCLKCAATVEDRVESMLYKLDRMAGDPR